MNNKPLMRLAKTRALLLLVVCIVAGIVAMPFAQAEKYEASFINKLENVQVNYQDYLHSSVDSNHSVFNTENFTSDKLGLTYEDVSKVLGDTKVYELSGGLATDDVYIDEKIPFGYNYADSDPDVYSTHNNHGNHVSGVIVGNDETIRGVAPNAQLFL